MWMFEKSAHQNVCDDSSRNGDWCRCPYRANQVREHPKDEAKADKDDAIGNKLSPSFHPLVVPQEHPLDRELMRKYSLNCLPSRWWRWWGRRQRWRCSGRCRRTPGSWRQREGRRQAPIPHAPLLGLTGWNGLGWGWFEQTDVLASSCHGSSRRTAMRMYFLLERICAVIFSNICFYIASSISSKHHVSFLLHLESLNLNIQTPK